MTPLDWRRLERGAEHLHQLGPRAIAEFLIELTSAIGGLPAALRLLCAYYENLTPTLLRMVGADRFSGRRPRVVPTDLEQVEP